MYFTRKKLSTLGFAAAAIFFLLAGDLTASEKVYQALSLDDCLALAREKNPTLGAARERVRELMADYEAARSQFFPKLTLISYYQRLETDRLSPGGAATTQNLFGREGLTSLIGKQIVFDGLQTYYNTKAATLGRKAQHQEVARTAEEVAFLATEAFYRLLEAKEDVRVAETALQERWTRLRPAPRFWRRSRDWWKRVTPCAWPEKSWPAPWGWRIRSKSTFGGSCHGHWWQLQTLRRCGSRRRKITRKSSALN